MIVPGIPTRLSVLLPANQEVWHTTVSRLLEPQGIQTVPARSGREALRIVESGTVHVCVLDNEMPQLGGMQIIRRMADMATRPPTILLADRLNNHLLQEALGMDVFSVLSKPVDLNQFLDSLARVIRRFYESKWSGVDAGPELHS